MKRHRISPWEVCWKAIATEPTEYQSSENVNTLRRPNLSGSQPRQNVPMKRPAKVAATNAPMPLKPKNADVVVCSMPLFAMPGAM